MPPDNRKDYDYKPRPAYAIPPIGARQFMHCFKSPHHFHGVDYTYNALPKLIDKTQTREFLHQTSDGDSNIGWGVAIEESLNWMGIIYMTCSILIMVLFVTLSSKYMLPDSVSAGSDRSFSTRLFICLLIEGLAGMLAVAAYLKKVAGDGSSRYAFHVRVNKEIDRSPSSFGNFLSVIVPTIRHLYAYWHNALSSITGSVFTTPYGNQPIKKTYCSVSSCRSINFS